MRKVVAIAGTVLCVVLTLAAASGIVWWTWQAAIAAVRHWRPTLAIAATAAGTVAVIRKNPQHTGGTS